MLIVTVGLPRSGKSSWARQRGDPIVNADAVRLALHGERFLAQAEPMVWTIVFVMAEALLRGGHDTVIVDGTHVSYKRRKAWEDFAGRVGCAIQFHAFTTSPAECKRRALATGQADLVPVIDRMASEWDYSGVELEDEI